MANTDRARKLLVRTALVTSTTIATIVGAQNLAMLDASQLLANPIPANDNANTLFTGEMSTPVAAVRATTELTILQAAPSIIILRQSGNTTTTRSANHSTNTTTAIQPPIPAQITIPDPVIVQQAVPQQSRSSR